VKLTNTLKFIIIILSFALCDNANAQILSRLAHKTTFEKSKSDCEAGKGEACAVHGYFHMTLANSESDIKQTTKYFEKSCNLDSGLGCFSLASILENGFSDRKDPKEANSKFEQSCKLNYEDGCINLGIKYAQGKSVAKDLEKSLTYLSKLCNSKTMRSCYYKREIAIKLQKPEIAKLHVPFKNNFENDIEFKQAAIKWQSADYLNANRALNKLCEKNKSNACVMLGESYFFGLGTKQDFSKAADLYEKGCNLNLPIGCDGLANAYVNGDGRQKDFNKALNLFTNACDLGVLDACYNLGKMYSEAEGVEKNLGIAFDLLDDACRNSILHACHNLGVLFFIDEENFDQMLAKKYLENALRIDPNFQPSKDALSYLMQMK